MSRTLLKSKMIDQISEGNIILVWELTLFVSLFRHESEARTVACGERIMVWWVLLHNYSALFIALTVHTSLLHRVTGTVTIKIASERKRTIGLRKRKKVWKLKYGPGTEKDDCQIWFVRRTHVRWVVSYNYEDRERRVDVYPFFIFLEGPGSATLRALRFVPEARGFSKTLMAWMSAAKKSLPFTRQ